MKRVGSLFGNFESTNSSAKTRSVGSSVFLVFGILVLFFTFGFDFSQAADAIIEDQTIKNVSTLQYKAVIGRPVKWIKRLEFTANNVSVELPKGSTNISVLIDEEIAIAVQGIEDYEEVVESVDREDIVKGSAITGYVALDIEKKEGIFTRLWSQLTDMALVAQNYLMKFTILGNVIRDDSADPEEFQEEIIETSNATIIEISDIVDEQTEVAVEYYTEAPIANETDLSNGKRIIVSAPSELNYTDILAYTVVEGEGIAMSDLKLELYWYEDPESPIRDDSVDPEEVTPVEVLGEEIIDEEIAEEVIEEEPAEIVENITEETAESPIRDDLVSPENATEIIVEEETIENITEIVEETVGENITEEEIIESPIRDDSVDPDDLVSPENVTEEEITIEEIEEEPEAPISLITGQVILEEENLENEIEKYLDSNVKVDRTRKSVEFVPYDFDSDGYVDYIEWVVPHLSVQVYEIIYITGAEHLDINREVIENVFDEVSEQDNVWSSPILEDEYLRVRFERELDNSKDITIHVRSSGISDILVYTKDGNNIIARFENVAEEATHKIYLTELTGRHDSFDLKVVGNSVEFDYVVDPTPITLSVPQTFNIHGRLSNATDAVDGIFEFTFNIYNTYSGGSSLWNSVRNVTVTDGIFYNVILNATGLNFSEQYYLGITIGADSEMAPRMNLTTDPYAFMAQNVYVGGVIFDENMDASGYNITADYFIGDGSLLTGIDYTEMWTNTSGDATFMDGNVGIGTTSPSSKLEVNGSINVTSGALYFPDGTNMTTAASGSGSGLWTNESGTATYDGDAEITGNITIGGTQITFDANGDVHVW
jgi:hypothetical protein